MRAENTRAARTAYKMYTSYAARVVSRLSLGALTLVTNGLVSCPANNPRWVTKQGVNPAHAQIQVVLYRCRQNSSNGLVSYRVISQPLILYRHSRFAVAQPFRHSKVGSGLTIRNHCVCPIIPVCCSSLYRALLMLPARMPCHAVSAQKSSILWDSILNAGAPNHHRPNPGPD